MRIKVKYHKFLLAFFVFQHLFLISQHLFAQTYGLKFNGFSVNLNKRTELDLSPDEFIKFHDEFEISFDYKITRLQTNSNVGFFGYIFRIINQEDKNIDLLSTPTPGIGLNLVIGKSNTILPIEFPREAINDWIKLRIKFLLEEDKLIFYTPDTFYVYENIGFLKQESFKIIFGANDYKQFKNTDVPSMTIKDIEIAENGKLKYYWPLDEKEGNIAYDRLKRKEAKVINPSWVIQNHQSWQSVFKDEIAGKVTVAADTENERIFMVGMDDITIYSASKNSARKIKYKNNPVFMNKSYRAIYNSLDNKIYCYLVDNGPFYILDVETGEWDNTDFASDFETRFRHHNHFFCASDSSIYVFGGYGRHTYNNKIRRIDINKGTWEDLPVNNSVFTPRYLSGLGSLNDTVYILGGYGSESGNQLINPHSYFDLLGYSVKNRSLFKKFEIPHMIEDMIVGNSMWIDEKNREYYALIFSKIKFDGELQLIKGNLDSPEVQLVGDKVPLKFLDIRAFANLYYMPQPNKLYAYTSYATDSISEIAIYSIDNPPNNALVEADQLGSNKNWILLITSAFVILSGLGIWAYRRKRKLDIISQKQVSTSESGILAKPLQNFEEMPEYQLILFGGFQVFSKDMTDITNKFSPLLKELFLLVLLYTFKNNKGISSEKITELLWYDKSEKSARNNRAVNIAKLRSILEEMGSCELSKKTGYWKINLKDTQIKSDYVDFLNIIVSKNNLNKQKINQLIEITQKGAFLSNVHYEWLDDFKALVSDKIVDTLVIFGQSVDVKKEAEFVIHLADSIFNFDVVNEDAMILKCQAEYCKGKHSIAKTTYERFYKEYVTMYGQEYERAFLDILNIK